jgi:MFS family permease
VSATDDVLDTAHVTDTGSPARGAFASWYSIIALTLLYVLAFIDRQVIALLATPIKRDLGLSDVELSLLMGLAFVILFSVLGLPAGWLADRVSRKRMIGLGVALWSAMTIVSGLARSYTQLFIGHVGVGVGESAIVPASFSLIQASLPPTVRGKAFGIFSLGPTFGISLSLVLGGLIFSAAEAGRFSSVPFVSELKSWQAVFVLLGLFGLPLSLLAMTLQEPVRRAASERTGVAGFGEALRHVRAHLRAYVLLVGFITCTSTFAFSFGAWSPSMLVRNFNLTPAEVGYLLGPSSLAGSLLGQLLFGTIIDRLTKQGHLDAAPRVGLFTVTATLLLAIVIPWTTSLGWATALITLFISSCRAFSTRLAPTAWLG